MAHDFILPRDADYKQPCQWTNVAGAAVDITGLTITANMKSYPARSAVNLAPTVVITTAASGLFSVNFTAAQSAALVKERYVWEVLITKGAFLHRVLSGTIRVRDTGDDLAAPVTLVGVLDPIT